MSKDFLPRILRFALWMSLGPWILSGPSCTNNPINSSVLGGQVMSGTQGLGFTSLTLFSTGMGTDPQVLGVAESDGSGRFSLSYNPPTNAQSILYLTAVGPSGSTTFPAKGESVSPIRLATILGTAPFPSEIVVNERTTVAAAFAMAQFITEAGIIGTAPGLNNAAGTFRNLVNVGTGDIASVLGNPPNGSLTSTLARFHSLSNLLAACVSSQDQCPALFKLTTPPQGTPPADTFEAAWNMARFPGQNVADLLSLSQIHMPYLPALAPDADLNAWTLVLRYVGNGHELDGPGNIAFDASGNAWITNNYLFHLDPLDPQGLVCGDDHVIALSPTGEDLPGAPYPGGGLYGAGFGITLDPEGNIWIGNFAFQGSNCPNDIQELSQTVSEFAPNGTPLSPNSQGSAVGQDHGGFPGANHAIRLPQGTVSDPAGNVWIANCGGNSLTQFRAGDPTQDFEFAPVDGSNNPLLQNPFDIAIDGLGNAWVTSNSNHSVFAFDTKGNLIRSLTGAPASDAGILHPMGIAGDSVGNIWVANSGIVQLPCPPNSPTALFDAVNLASESGFKGENASVTMILPDGSAAVGSPFQGGGLLLPWGIAVDGNDNIWVANFAGQRLSFLCGARPETCPPGFQTGQPISPPDGYQSDALVRNTGLAIDPSGNVWLANNWENIPIQQNPGGHEIVVFVGLAKPVKPPLIGPPNGL